MFCISEVEFSADITSMCADKDIGMNEDDLDKDVISIPDASYDDTTERLCNSDMKRNDIEKKDCVSLM